MIAGFQGEHRYLSNFWLTPVEYAGHMWPSVEHAYQWAKCSDETRVSEFMSLTSGQAKRAGGLITVGSRWHSSKIMLMRALVLDKFSRNPELAEKLLATGDRRIIELNTHNDTFWGVVRDEQKRLVGTNHLGSVLMYVRSVLNGTGIEFT